MDAIITGWILCPSGRAITRNKLRLQAMSSHYSYISYLENIEYKNRTWLKIEIYKHNLHSEIYVFCSLLIDFSAGGSDSPQLLLLRGFRQTEVKYLHLSRLGQRFLGVLGGKRWGYERSCRTARRDSESEATPTNGLAWKTK